MEAIYVGWLSILPPIIAIVLALATKEVISSLLIGIFSGTLIYAFASGGGLLTALETTFTLMGNKMADNVQMILFLSLLGALVVVVTLAGGSQAYGNWAAKKIKTKSGAQLATCALGGMIFIDDYFNCLTVGTVMKPITDKHRVSRAKLAYIIDSTAAPVCIIAPISSWATAVGSNLKAAGGFENELSAFISTIPYNLYAILAIVMVIITCKWRLDFGLMAKLEAKAEKDDIGAIDLENTGDLETSTKGRVFDLLIPIGALILFAVTAMLYTGGFFSGQGVSIAAAFGDCSPTLSLVYSGFGALIVAFLLFVPRKIISFKTFMDGISGGIKSMVPALIILTLAWTISGVCRDLLCTGQYVGDLVANSNFPVALLPALVFLIAAALSFSMGTAWGTFGILIPIIVVICEQVAPDLMIVTLAATLAGSVFGDHCSPISDTTILSSTGAGCNHIEHVSSQMSYAVVVAINCFIGYLVAGLTRGNLPLTLLVSLGCLVISVIFLHKRSVKKLALEEANGTL